ncbi:unnamed protein product [Prunus armeniaca]|uniref:Uncharacterized protein n=1 Tax=Prunus armeniaca TaxID=36596 RepID=A0A6J5TR39_PRUAR|nr:unnamed protein product [Prunus armeniaca]
MCLNLLTPFSHKNKSPSNKNINLKGIAQIHKHCADFASDKPSDTCLKYQLRSDRECGEYNVDIYNIYAPLCRISESKSVSTGSVHHFDPCSSNYVEAYLNLVQVQSALHVKATNWSACGYA